MCGCMRVVVYVFMSVVCVSFSVHADDDGRDEDGFCCTDLLGWFRWRRSQFCETNLIAKKTVPKTKDKS